MVTRPWVVEYLAAMTKQPLGQIVDDRLVKDLGNVDKIIARCNMRFERAISHDQNIDDLRVGELIRLLLE